MKKCENRRKLKKVEKLKKRFLLEKKNFESDKKIFKIEKKV